MGEFERKLEGNYELPIDGPLASPTPGPALAPSESMSTLHSTGGGYKYKTHLLSRYSSQLEEENRILKELLSQQLQPPSLGPHLERMSSLTTADPLLRLREISDQLETEAHHAQAVTRRHAPATRVRPASAAQDDVSDQELYSDLSQTSGYRSSEHSSEGQEQEDREQQEEEWHHHHHTRSILKSMKADRSKLFLNIQPGAAVSVSPAREELPDLECVRTAASRQLFPGPGPASASARFSPRTPRRKISFVSPSGVVMAASEARDKSGLDKEEIVRRVSSSGPAPCPAPAPSQEVFSRLRQISDDLAAGGGSVVFVDAGGRVVASSTQVRSPPGTRRELGAQLRRSVNTAEVQLQVAASKAEDTQPAASASAAWDKLREISRTLEAGPSLT